MLTLGNSKRLLIIVLSVILASAAYAQEQVDAGIFESSASDTFYIKARPTYNIENLSVTNAQLTIRWEESSGVTELSWISSVIGLFPQGSPVLSDGYYYQVYASFGGTSLNWTEGEEYFILSVMPDNTNFNCSKFEIALDDWTGSNNGDYYFEIIGEDRTGIRYEPYLNYGSEGGYVDGDTTIHFGESTGLLTLNDYYGGIMIWQESFDSGAWQDIPGTQGLTEYETYPTDVGLWQYRAEVQKTGCPSEFSDPAEVLVERFSEWTGVINTDWHNPGNWNIQGVPDETLDAVIPVVTSGVYPEIDSAAMCKAMIIEEDAGVDINTEGSLTLSGYLLNNGTLTLHSGEGICASLIDNGNIQGSGNYMIERYISGNGDHLVSSPVDSAYVSLFSQHELFRWEEPSGSWVALSAPDSLLETFNGYLVEPSASDTIVFADAPSTGRKTLEWQNSGNGNATDGLMAAGNPFPSSVNWEIENGQGWEREGVANAIYIYDPTKGNYGTYILDDPYSSINGVDSIIPPHQGFFVHAPVAGSQALMEVRNAARLHGNVRFLKGHNVQPSRKYCKLRVSGESFSDEAIIQFDQAATDGFDPQYDALDLAGIDEAPQLFTIPEGEKELSVNTHSELVENTSVSLGFITGTPGTFNLEVTDLLNFDPMTQLLLEDTQADSTMDLISGLNYEFTGAPEDPPGRFILHFNPEPVFSDELVLTNDFEFRYSGNTLIIGSSKPVEGKLIITDLAGRTILKDDFRHEGSYSLDLLNVHKMLIVTVISGSEIFSGKVMVY